MNVGKGFSYSIIFAVILTILPQPVWYLAKHFSLCFSFKIVTIVPS